MGHKSQRIGARMNCNKFARSRNHTQWTFLKMLPSLAFGFLLLLSLFACITDRNPWSTGTLGAANASVAFQAQFTNIEDLALSSLHSTDIINDLRTDSLALEDLSHAIKPTHGGLVVPSDVPVQLRNLSKNANAVADALEQFYLKVTGMAELWVTISAARASHLITPTESPRLVQFLRNCFVWNRATS